MENDPPASPRSVNSPPAFRLFHLGQRLRVFQHLLQCSQGVRGGGNGGLGPARPETSRGDPLVPFTVPGGAKTKFTSVIEKCSKLLQYHPESGLVDNCLMMIGMSYFYQADYQRAERKFVELIETYPDGEYTMEARLMLARTAFKKKERQRAKELSTELLTLAEEEGEDEIVAHAAGILGRLAYEDGQYRSRALVLRDNGGGRGKRGPPLLGLPPRGDDR